MDRLKKLKEKKGQSKMHPMEQKAKMGVVEDMRNMADQAMGSRLKGLNKVTVASDSEEGLEHGLDKAHDVLKHLPVALDDSHPDHENFLHSENKEDGMDGMSAYPDADGDHLLEMDEEPKHAEDEANENEQQLAMGGEARLEDHESEEQREEAAMMPSYDDMDRGEMSAHLEQLVAAMKRKGLA